MTNVTMKQYTEPIFAELAGYRAELAQHPLLTAARGGELSPDLLRTFAFYQYSDSVLWIPMLAQMKAKATRSARLRRAIEDNIAHEAGLGSVAHVSLAVAMMRSLGVTSLDALGALAGDTLARSATLWLSDDFADFGEPEIAGWLLAAETLVPVMFAAMLPSFDALACDTRYFTEHVTVDTDEHATWMAESVRDVLALHGPSCASAIADGVRDAWQETREIPDQLWSVRCASR